MASFEEKLLRGDKKAFEQLVRENQNKIYAVCLNMLKNPHDAQDAAQDTFVKAYTRISSFRGSSSVVTWLTKIAMNTCMDMLKAQRQHLNIDDQYDLADEETTESAAQKNTNVRAVRQALKELPPEFRAVIVLRHIENLSYDEIAAALNLDPGTVKSRLWRAREKLKKIFLENRELF